MKVLNGDTDEVEIRLSSMAERLVNLNLDSMAIFFLETFGPMSSVWSQLGRLHLQPLLILLGPSGEKLMTFLEKPENLERFIKKIEEARERRTKGSWIGGILRRLFGSS
ncbi:MAG: hypothetical protein QXD04_04105 [Candidatus Bathyarchaeia archaeon]